MSHPCEIDSPLSNGPPRTLRGAYVAPSCECEKAISHHFRQQRPLELIRLVPDVAAEVSVLREEPEQRPAR